MVYLLHPHKIIPFTQRHCLWCLSFCFPTNIFLPGGTRLVKVKQLLNEAALCCGPRSLSDWRGSWNWALLVFAIFLSKRWGSAVQLCPALSCLNWQRLEMIRYFCSFFFFFTRHFCNGRQCVCNKESHAHYGLKSDWMAKLLTKDKVLWTNCSNYTFYLVFGIQTASAAAEFKCKCPSHEINQRMENDEFQQLFSYNDLIRGDDGVRGRNRWKRRLLSPISFNALCHW